MPQPRYHVIAHQLTKVPPELVHEIINDLPILKILELISNHDVPYIEECICSHMELGKIFSPEFLAEVKSYFVLYLRILRLDSRFPHPILPSLDHDAHTFRKKLPIVNIIPVIIAAIMQRLETYEPLFPLLQIYAPERIPPKTFWVTDSASGLQQIFENIDAAETKLNALKSAQLERMANLIHKYPGMTRVRENVSQEPRKNEQHLVNQLLYMSIRMKNQQILRKKFVASWIFGRRGLFLVPYDRLLRLFLKTINKFSPISEHNVGSASRKNHHQYPVEIKIVLDGLSTIYSRDAETSYEELEPIPRTLYTKYSVGKSVVASGPRQPSFWPHRDPAPIKDIQLRTKLLPASDKELDWLEAFLSVCKYMAEMKAEWKEGQTVGEYWYAH